MATGGREEGLGSVAADDAENEVLGVPCAPCGKTMKKTPAVSFCNTHKEYLCGSCCDKHQTCVSGKHDVMCNIEKTLIDLTIDMKRLDRCLEHGRVFVKFCRGHNELCCPDCCTSTHVRCSEIAAITQCSTLVDDSFLQSEPAIRSCITVATSLVGRCDDYLKEMASNEQLNIILKEIDEFRQNINSRIDNARSQIEKEFKESIETEQESCESIKSTAENVKSSLEDVLSVIRQVRAGGSNVEKFILNSACNNKREKSSRELSCLNMKDIQRALQWDPQLLKFLNTDASPVTMLERDLKRVYLTTFFTIRI